MKKTRTSLRIAVALGTALASAGASAAPYYYVDWTNWNPGAGTARGTITPSSGPAVRVDFAALTAKGGAGTYLGVTGSSLWAPTTTYTSAQVGNASAYEALQLEGDHSMTYRVTLSEAVKDPIMAIASLGAKRKPATYVFDSPFAILSQGPSCCWGGDADKLVHSDDAHKVLTGRGGAGTIQFIGTYKTFSWTVPDPEYWHGFTFGIRTTERIEPNPVPEPSALALVGLGLLGLGAARRRPRA